MRHAVALACLALLSIAGVACHTRQQPAPCAAGDSPTLRIAFPDVRGSAAEFRGAPVTYWTDQALVWIDGHGRPIPALAQTWERTDARTWTFTLRPDLRSHNGLPFTADRARTALLKYIAEEPKPLWRDLQSIDAPTPTTLVFRLARPNSQLPEAVSGFTMAGYTLDDPELATGPWRVTEQRRDRVKMVRFGPILHPGTNPARLEIQAYPDMRASWAAFLRHEVDVVHDVSPSAVATLSQNPDIRLYSSEPAMLYAMGFRIRNLLRDARIRQAINLAINRDDILQHLYGGAPALVRNARPLAGPFSPEYWAMEGGDWHWPYDVTRARALLREAMGARTDAIELTCITSSESPEIADIAANVEAQLQRVHIRLRLEPLPYRAVMARMAQGDFDAFIMQMAAGRAAAYPYWLWRSGDRSADRPVHTGYAGADEALDQLYTAASPEAERAGVRAVMEAVHRDPPAAFLVSKPQVRGIRSNWHVPDDGRPLHLSLDRWTLDPPCGS